MSPTVRTSYVEQGAALLDIRNGNSYSFNPTAALLWRTLEQNPEGVTLEQILSVLENRFKIPHELLARDVSEWLRQLENLEIARTRDSQPRKQRFRGVSPQQGRT